MAEYETQNQNRARVVIGYDISDSYAQISYCTLDGRVPETVSTVTGEEIFNIPVALWMNLAGNQWHYGKEAVQRREDASGVFLDRLLSRAYQGEEIELDGRPFRAQALLSLFLKRTMSLLPIVGRRDALAAILFTVDDLDERMAQVLTEAAQAIRGDGVICYFQGREESFFYYNLYQPQDLWLRETLLCELTGSGLKLLRLYRNQKAKPQVSFAQTEEYADFTVSGNAQEMDASFLSILQKACEGHLISAVYLIGDGFLGDWYRQSLRFLCQGRRVFLGSNLYSKGACYACLEKIAPSDLGREHMFLGRDQLKANIGMQASRRGEESYFVLLNAGETWYEARRELDFLLEEGNRFSLLVAQLSDGKVKQVAVTLTDLPPRPPRTSRIHLQIYLTAVDRIHLTIEDLGFGELFPASHRVWQEEFSLDEL